MENLQTLFRCIAAGDTMIFISPEGNYIAHQCKGTSILPENSIEVTIESRLQFELYGEYPLSEYNELDYNRTVRGAFKLPVIESSLQLIKNHSL